jgi:hypothetical protein
MLLMRAKVLTAALTLVGISILGVTLQWDANPATDNVVKYNLYQGSTNVASTTNLDIAFPTLPGSNYTFSVTAVDVSGIESLPSESFAYTEPLLAIIPNSPQITNSIWQKYQGKWYVQVAWATVSNATSYVVRLQSDANQQVLTTTNHTYSNIALPFVSWTIYVQAQNAAGITLLDSFTSSPHIPSTPIGLKAQP